jgi:hypothetical protein
MKQSATRSAAERILDRAIELTFPASDPIAVEHAFRSARKLDQTRSRKNPKPTGPKAVRR